MKWETFVKREKGAVAYFVCEPLERAGFLNAFSTRGGGVSPLPQNDLNMSYLKDSKENVDENRRRFLEAIGVTKWPVATLKQTHSDTVIVVKSKENQSEGDALVTDKAGLFVGVKTADCLPLLIGDPKTGGVAAVHAGWQGTLQGIAEKTVKHLQKKFNADPKNLIAALGPSACADCFEVGDEVIANFQKEFSYAADLFKKTGSPKLCLDMPNANVRQLIDSGLTAQNIHVTSFCTMHENGLFFSHRVEGKTNPDNVGRMLSVIGRAR